MTIVTLIVTGIHREESSTKNNEHGNAAPRRCRLDWN